MRREQLNCKSIEGGLHLGGFGPRRRPPAPSLSISRSPRTGLLRQTVIYDRLLFLVTLWVLTPVHLTGLRVSTSIGGLDLTFRIN